jgi:hypothetical protein
MPLSVTHIQNILQLKNDKMQRYRGHGGGAHVERIQDTRAVGEANGQIGERRVILSVQQMQCIYILMYPGSMQSW